MIDSVATFCLGSSDILDLECLNPSPVQIFKWTSSRTMTDSTFLQIHLATIWHDFSLIDTCSLQRLKPSDYILLTHTPKTLKRQLSCFGSPQISSCNRQETHCDYLGTFNACFSFLTKKKKPLNAIVSMSLFISTWIHSNLFIVEITPTSILLWQK